MASSADHANLDEPVERFKPTSGLLMGYAGLAFAGVILLYVAWRVHTVTGLQVALGVSFFALVIWVTQLRSRATAYPDRLLLKNSVRDVVIPLARIDEVAVRQTLQVWVGERRYVCLGIGRSMREIVKGRRGGAVPNLLGSSRMHQFAEMAEKAAPDQTAMTYQTFVEVRIDELADQARKAEAKSGRTGPSQPRTEYAWPEITALLLTGLGFLGSLLL